SVPIANFVGLQARRAQAQVLKIAGCDPCASRGTARARLLLVSVPVVSRRLFGVVLVALGAGACLSPTLPLPPPSRPTMEGPDAAGNVRLFGRVPGKARVSALNSRTQFISGQQTRDDGKYDFT